MGNLSANISPQITSVKATSVNSKPSNFWLNKDRRRRSERMSQWSDGTVNDFYAHRGSGFVKQSNTQNQKSLARKSTIQLVQSKEDDSVRQLGHFNKKGSSSMQSESNSREQKH